MGGRATVGAGSVALGDGRLGDVRNVGNGIAVLDRWDLHPEHLTSDVPHRAPGAFRRLTRDLYVPAGDLGFWQGAFRDPTDPVRAGAAGDRRAPSDDRRPALR
jgi:hypothetical protein